MASVAITRLLVVSPVRVHADALARTLEAAFELQHVDGATGQADALGKAIAHSPTVVLLDFRLDDLVSCIQAIRRVAPPTPFIAFGVGHDDGTGERLIRAAQAGVSSFVDADHGLSDLFAALRMAADGVSYCSPRVAGHLLQSINLVRLGAPQLRGLSSAADDALLSHRERVVAELVTFGLTNREIANRLVVAEATVKSHVHAILHKLGVSSRDEVRLWLNRTPDSMSAAAKPRMG